MPVSANMQVRAYIVDESRLLLDAQRQLPVVPACPDDLMVQQGALPTVVRAFRASAPEAIPPGCDWIAIRELISAWNQRQFEQLSAALQLLHWRQTHQFCSNCGSKTRAHTTEWSMRCPDCQLNQYPRIQPCVIVAILNDQQQILLARSAQRPGVMFSLIAGFVEVGETLEQAVAREVLEEVGLQVKQIQYMASQPWPFPSNLMIGFKAYYAGGNLVLQADEIAEAAFFDFNRLPALPPPGSIAHWMINQLSP